MKRKGAAEDTRNKQCEKNSSARKLPSVTRVSADTGTDGHKKRLLIISILLIITAFIAFWQVTHSDFINLDDAGYVTENKHIQEGFTAEGVLWAFTTGHAGYWHPLTWISHMLDVQLFGFQPGWHHLTNLLFHLANTLMLFLGLQRMTKALWQSAFVAVLFAVHPLHVESVAWVAERKDVLSTFFWMLTMYIYVSYVARPRLTCYLTLLFCFALGLMAKPMLVTLPFALLLLDYWPLQRLEQNKPTQQAARKRLSNKTAPPVKTPVHLVDHWPSIYPLLKEKIPLFSLTVLFSIITYIAQRHGGAVTSLAALSPGARLSNAFVSYVTYMVKMLWPTNLAVFYPHPRLLPLWQVLSAVALLIAITVVAIRSAKKRPYAAVGWLWYVGTLVPVIGLVQVGAQASADRFTYIPLVGLFIIVAWAIPEALKKWPYRKEALIALSAFCLACLFLITYRQVGYWRNSIALYDRTVEVTENNSLILNSRGVAYTNLSRYTQAIADFNRAIEIDPRYGEAYYNRGLAYKKLAKYTQAIADFNRAIEINPRLCAAYFSRGLSHGFLGNYAQAIADFNRAIEINPQNEEAYYSRGVAYGLLGNYAQAIADLNRAIEINPRNEEAYYSRGVAYGSLGNRERAIDDIRTAARLGHEGAKGFLRSQGVSS